MMDWLKIKQSFLDKLDELIKFRVDHGRVE